MTKQTDGKDRPTEPLNPNDSAPYSLEELMQRNVEIIGELEKSAHAQRSYTDRMADAISRFAGSMKFVFLHVGWFGLSIAFNSLPAIPSEWQFDRFPFTFLTFVVSLEAIFLSTFILISQNHEERLAQRRTHLDLQINLLSEQENSLMLRMLESIEKKLEIPSQPHAKALQEATSPEAIVDEIRQGIEKH
jgi:uncharacterized membrane protein